MIYVIKIGGNVIDNSELLNNFLKNFVSIEGDKILIHGGGKLATQLAERLNVPQQMVNGRRITDDKTLEVVTMVYAGSINKNIIAKLSALGCKALGICGADADIVRAERRPVKDHDYGYVGDIKKVDDKTLFEWLSSGITLAIAPLTHDGSGQLLNTNADTLASEIAIALCQHTSVRLIYCFERKGVLLDIGDETSVLAEINETEFEQLKIKGLVHSGMLPKIENALNTIKKGVESVVIGHAGDLPDILNSHAGTKISLT